MTLPSAIIFLNSDINSATQTTLTTQLYINETITFDEFNSRVAVDPTYSTVVHLQSLRILVILPNFQILTNRSLADIVLFFNQGQVTIERNNFGPTGLSLPADRVNIYELLRYNHSPNVVCLPPEIFSGKCCCDNLRNGNCGCKCKDCGYPFKTCGCSNHNRPGIGGIVAEELNDSSGIYAPNCDSEANNYDFIHRK